MCPMLFLHQCLGEIGPQLVGFVRRSGLHGDDRRAGGRSSILWREDCDGLTVSQVFFRL
jgi:hypothetical protein